MVSLIKKYIYIIIEEKPICGSRSNGSCCWLLCFYRSMSCKPVVPGCSLIKTNVSLFPPFSNYLFIYLFCLTQQEHSIRALLGVLLVLVCQKRSAYSHGGLLAEKTSLYAWRWLCYGCFCRRFCFLIFAPLLDWLFSWIFVRFTSLKKETGSDWMSALIYRNRHWRDLTGCADRLPWWRRWLKLLKLQA